jgi:uncharacterized protein YkwD
MSSIILTCARCHGPVAVPQELSGRWVSCPNCGMQFAALTSEPPSQQPYAPLGTPPRRQRSWMQLGWLLTAVTGMLAATLIIFAIAQVQVGPPSPGSAEPAPPAIARAPDHPSAPAPTALDRGEDESSDWDDLPPIPPPVWIPELPFDPAPVPEPDRPPEEPRPRLIRPTNPRTETPIPLEEPAPKETPPSASAVDLAVLKRLNAHRKLVGLGPVGIDPTLSEGCTAHARYLVRNQGNSSLGGLRVHGESTGLRGYTKSGATAGARSVIMQGMGMARAFWQVNAVDGWIATLYHRLPLLHPDLQKVGVGYATSGEGRFYVAVLDARSGLPRRGRVRTAQFRSVIYPANDQKNVPCVFSFGAPEMPNPIPNNGNSRDAGYPITVTFFDAWSVDNVDATLTTGEGKECPVWLSTPKRPAYAGFPQQGTVCLIPKSPLRPLTTYSVAMSATVSGISWQETWKFVTASR